MPTAKSASLRRWKVIWLTACLMAAASVGAVDAPPDPAAIGKRVQAGYLIVVADPLVDAVKPFAEWKRSLGFKVLVASTTTTGKTCKRIKAYVKTQYEKWRDPSLDYVLLVGDIDTVPAHIETTVQGKPATDLLYSTFEGDDYFPDLGLGRFPARTAQEARCMIAKTIEYEKGEFATSDWIGRAAFMTSSSFYQHCERAAEYCLKYTAAAGYTGTFPKAGQPGGARLYAETHKASTPELKSVFEKGCGIMAYQRHAVESGWRGPKFDRSSLRGLGGMDARPFVVSISCLSGRHDWERDCFGEVWMKMKGGPVAFFGASRNSLFPHCLTMQIGIFDAIFKGGIRDLAGICNAGKRAVFKKHGA